MAGRYDATKVSAAKAIKKSGVAMTLNHKGTTAATNPWDPPTETTTGIPMQWGHYQLSNERDRRNGDQEGRQEGLAWR